MFLGFSFCVFFLFFVLFLFLFFVFVFLFLVLFCLFVLFCFSEKEAPISDFLYSLLLLLFLFFSSGIKLKVYFDGFGKFLVIFVKKYFLPLLKTFGEKKKKKTPFWRFLKNTIFS